MSAPVRVLNDDDDALVRAGLTMIQTSADDVQVVGEAADGSGVPEAVAQHRPDVVLMDIRMPRVDGLAATEALRRQTGAPGAIPGTGTGLIGLAERATLAGGRLAHGRTPEGDFAVTAWLPWPA